MTTTKYEFDAVRYCQANMDRMGVMPTGQAVGALIIGEINALRARVARLEEALRFILDECDWEESMSTVCGDNRIGVAVRRALEEK